MDRFSYGSNYLESLNINYIFLKKKIIENRILYFFLFKKTNMKIIALLKVELKLGFQDMKSQVTRSLKSHLQFIILNKIVRVKFMILDLNARVQLMSLKTSTIFI